MAVKEIQGPFAVWFSKLSKPAEALVCTLAYTAAGAVAGGLVGALLIKIHPHKAALVGPLVLGRNFATVAGTTVALFYAVAILRGKEDIHDHDIFSCAVAGFGSGVVHSLGSKVSGLNYAQGPIREGLRLCAVQVEYSRLYNT